MIEGAFVQLTGSSPLIRRRVRSRMMVTVELAANGNTRRNQSPQMDGKDDLRSFAIITTDPPPEILA